MATGNTAKDLADSLPVCGDLDDNGDEVELISLCDIVVTGIETGWSHFWVRKYDPDNLDMEWAIVAPLRSAGKGSKPILLNEARMRLAVQAYIQSRLDRGMTLAEVTKLVDGVYTDAVVADSILQFAIYQEEVFS